MPRRSALAALLFAFIVSACGGANAGDPVELRVTTATPSPTPDVTPTPLEQPELVLSTTEVYQGGTVLVSVTGDVRDGNIRFMGRDHALTRGERSMYSFVGVDIDDAAGTQTLEVEFETSNGSRGSLDENVEVLETAWEVDELYFEPGEADELLEPELAEEEAEMLDEVYARYTPEKNWDEPWLVPNEGSVTARFGSLRSINDGPPTDPHSGTDIGAEEGSPVVTTNGGTVILADYLDVRGNTVIVDHGGGVLSGYAHLSEISVAEGEALEPGDLVGAVGSTGRSTGPHLHWEMAVHGVRVDPWRFVDGTNGF